MLINNSVYRGNVTLNVISGIKIISACAFYRRKIYTASGVTLINMKIEWHVEGLGLLTISSGWIAIER